MGLGEPDPIRDGEPRRGGECEAQTPAWSRALPIVPVKGELLTGRLGRSGPRGLSKAVRPWIWIIIS